MAATEYDSSSHPPELAVSEVHVHCVSLSACEDLEQRFAGLLSSDEQDRAARFHFEADRARFTVARGVLRRLLAKYLARPARELQFVLNEFGKPRIEGQTDVSFNVSHTHDVALYAFVRATEIGIDVERHRELNDADAVANHCLSSTQYAQFVTLKGGAKRRAFFRFWTRKEALIKAIGRGLSQPLKEFDVTFLDDEPPRLLRASSEFDDISGWTLQDVPVSNRHHASLAIRGHGFNVNLFGSIIDDES